MIVYPAIDLRGGVCVRLMQGRFDQATVYDPDPTARLAAFVRAGAAWVHIVDLDGAEAGRAVQHSLIGRLAASAEVRIQAGGGVRTTGDVEALLNAGAARVVVGSLAITAPEIVAEWLARFGTEKLTLAIDVRAEGDAFRPVLKGWTQAADTDLWDALDRYPRGLARHLLVTDVGRDGAMSGPNQILIADIMARRPDLQVQLSGGVGDLDDLTAARRAGCAGAIVGRALYEGRFTLEQALAA